MMGVGDGTFRMAVSMPAPSFHAAAPYDHCVLGCMDVRCMLVHVPGHQECAPRCVGCPGLLGWAMHTLDMCGMCPLCPWAHGCMAHVSTHPWAPGMHAGARRTSWAPGPGHVHAGHAWHMSVMSLGTWTCRMCQCMSLGARDACQGVSDVLGPWDT